MKTDFFPDFTADWREMTFIHYRFSPEEIRPAAAFPLDTYCGEAYVSLVLFRLNRLGPWGWGTLGRMACRPLSDHFFLNLRTYVRPEEGPGIEFLAEWIPNRISLLLGPGCYGLPYRWGAFTGAVQTEDEQRTWAVSDENRAGRVEITTRAGEGGYAACAAGSLDEFLFERYQAFTARDGVRRGFAVEHAPWKLRRPAGVRCITGMIERVFPWFARGELVGAHESDGFCGVRMTRPAVLRSSAPNAEVRWKRPRSRKAFFSVLE